MIKSIVAFTFASTCVLACSQSGAPPAAGGGQNPPPPASASPSDQAGSKPAAETPRSASDATPPSTDAASKTAGGPERLAASPAQAAAGSAATSQAPTVREVTIPAGTALSVTVLSTLASNTSKIEDEVKGSLAKPVIVSGTTAVPAGSQITGSVTDARESGRVKGRATLAFRFDRLVANGETMRIQTAAVKREAAADRKSDVKKGGIGAGVGAIVGGVIGGGKGAAIGAVAGGTGTVLATRGKEVELPTGTVVTVRLQDPLTLNVPVR
jgi:hypothetical protein